MSIFVGTFVIIINALYNVSIRSKYFLIILLSFKMEGFLQIWHGFFSRWSKYYFRIHQDTLVFGPKRQQIQGRVHLKVAQIISIVDDPISFIIHTGTDTLRLRANSIEQRVKWFKKLKKIQKNIQYQNYVNPFSTVGHGKNSKNSLKMLESIVVDLWHCHAELQNQILNIETKFKGMKNLTDKLRMTVQSIKLKNSQALKILQQYTQSQKNHKSFNGRYYNNQQYSQQNDSNYHEPDGTKFMSFEDKNQRIFKKISHKFNSFQDSKQFKEFPNAAKMHTKKQAQQGNSIVSHYKLQSPIRNSGIQSGGITSYHPIKQRLLETNPVFANLKKNLNNNKDRATLPSRYTPEQTFSFSSILKGGGVGADLTKFALPVSVNEPLSMLQKGCQQMYYSKLLDEANEQVDSQKRMLYITVFLISQYSLSDMRTKKPFNPLLGQTFEFYDQQRKFNYISEQVSHHPPISAMHCLSDTFQVIDQSLAKTSFTGTSIKVIPQGKSKIKLQRFSEEEYLYNKCTICLNGLLMGKITVQVIGQLVVQCKTNKAIAKIKFHEKSLFKDTLNLIQGQITVNGQKCYAINGRWNESMRATNLRDKSVTNIWTKQHIPNKDYYYFNDYTMKLNHINKEILSEIAPTDCRLRPDQRALQYRDLDLADSQKLRLEQKQRAKRKENEQKKVDHVIKWFSLQKDQNGNQFFVTNRKYEDDRKSKNWTDYPDIF